MIPSPLSHTSAGPLEYDGLRDLLRGYTQSALGRSRLAALVPSADRAWIERQQELAAEIGDYLRAGGHFDFSGLLDPTRLVEKARIEGVALEAIEIRDVVAVVDRAAEWLEIALHPPEMKVAAVSSRLSAFGGGLGGDVRGPRASDSRQPAADSREAPWPAVAALSSAIRDFTGFLRLFRNKILPDGALEDRASPELARIRREIERQKRVIQESLQSYVRRLSDQGAAQEELVTIRGERFVIPVKAEQKRRVEGVVHGVSSSGQTVFVEPLETIEQNNDLVRLLEDEQVEIHRILLQMTRSIAEYGGAILAASEVLSELELQFAKARFAQEYHCVPARVRDGGLLLYKIRHPLLERTLRAKHAAIVPISVELGPADGKESADTAQGSGASGVCPEQSEVSIASMASGEAAAAPGRELVITGPNTGGKTLALKALGLLALMAQSGIPLPAERAELPVFDAVLADIGDYQSIEQNLSTFSAHVTNIDRISRIATVRSLVLLDELGSATDPEEGAALAVAIAEHFRRVGATAVISTHHTALKVYAATAAGVVNAAVGFDERTLQPTYVLQTGVPGASAGINIAQKLGLNPSIIAAARARLGAQSQDVADFLDRLHAELRLLEQERLAAQQRQQELERERARLALDGKREEREKIRELERKLNSLLKDFEYHAREAVQAVQERAAAQKLSKEAERRIARLRREFQEQFNQAVVAHSTGADRGDAAAQPHVVRQVALGDTVRLKSIGRTGTVTRRLDEDSFEVQVGPMKTRVARDDIAEVLQSPVEAARAQGVSVSLAAGSASVPTEINVIGKTADEAGREVEKFVDRAFLAGVTRLRIVHGSGMGILRKSLRQMLREHPHVSAVSEPPQHEGGGGATIVELRT
jgi:DNA mismatch repair protein MutS2